MLPRLDDSLVFRANPDYELVLLDRLPMEERDRLAALRRDSELYGVLRPRAGAVAAGRRTIAASRDVALLIFTLQQPGPLPSYVRSQENPEVERIVAQLVLDGMLDVQVDDSFISGPAAIGIVQPAAARVTGRIGELSRGAVVFAAGLHRLDAATLESRLYFYNRVPVTPEWTARVDAPQAIRRLLELDRGATATLLNRQWDARRDDSAEGWMYWRWLDTAANPLPRTAVLYKVYVSPSVGSLRDAFPTLVRVLTDAEAPTFKMGGSLHGLTRPDKIVAYFQTRARALECAEVLSHELAGITAQGVPFTAEIGADGLVSWGVDPPPRIGEASQSWRGWICRRLAHYLYTAAQAPEGDVPSWRYALQRLELDGIDTTTWTPDVDRLERPAAVPRSVS